MPQQKDVDGRPRLSFPTQEMLGERTQNGRLQSQPPPLTLIMTHYVCGLLGHRHSLTLQVVTFRVDGHPQVDPSNPPAARPDIVTDNRK
jgi:hypothetical protein